MKKPTLGTGGPPPSTPMSSPSAPTPAFPAMTPQEVGAYSGLVLPVGPGGTGFPPPAGPDGAVFNLNTSEDSTLPLRDTICVQCKHGLVLEAAAPVKNRKDWLPGSPAFTLHFGFCTFVSPPMALEDLKPIKCSRFERAATTFVLGDDGEVREEKVDSEEKTSE